MTDAGFRYLLDTNIVSDMVRNPAGRAATALAAIDDKTICTSIIVACEIRFGVARKASVRLARQVETVLSGLPILSFEIPADQHYGELRARLVAAGRPIGYNDFFIAAHALAMKMTLVTDNIREFRCVPGLSVENWLAHDR